MRFIRLIPLSALFGLLLMLACRSNAGKTLSLSATSTAIKLLLDSGARHLWKPGNQKQDMDSAYHYFSRAEQLSIRKKSIYWKHQVELILGDYYYELGADSLGKAVFHKVIHDHQRTKNIPSEAEAWLHFGATKSWDQHMIVQNLENSRIAYQLLKKNGYVLEAATALKQIADLHYQLREIPLAERELLEVIRLYQSVGYKNLHYTYDLLSGISVINGRYNKALYYAQEMIKSMDETKDSASVGSFYHRMADIQFRLGDFEESTKWWLRSYRHAYNIENVVRYDLARSAVFSMISSHKAKQALEFIHQVIATRPPVLTDDKRNAFLTQGVCFQGLKRYKEAERFFIKSIAEDNTRSERDALSSTINYYTGLFYVKTKQYQKALPFLNTVSSLTRQYPGVSRIMDTEYLYYKIDSASFRPYQAIRHFLIYDSIKDSIFNETKSKQIQELKVQYQIEKKQQDIQLLENHASLQQIYLSITYAGLLVLLVVIGVLFRFYRNQNNSNRKLKSNQVLINEKNVALTQLVKEKQWLLKEVHHRVKNNLQVVQSLLNSQSAYLTDSQALLAIQNSKNRVQAISLLHQKLYQSEDMSVINMNVYVQELCLHLRDSFTAESRIQFELNIADLAFEVSQAVPVGLIINEAVTNAIKYAFPNGSAGTISISLNQAAEGKVSLIVRDDGIGFPDQSDQLQTPTFGVKLMKGLTEDLDGILQMENFVGTWICLVFQPADPALPGSAEHIHESLNHADQ
jgi:two-component sensor histidine kinase